MAPPVEKQFINPITMAFALQERYSGLVRVQLLASGLSAADMDYVLGRMQIDQGLYLSLNRKYTLGRKKFRQYCRDHGLSSKLPNMLMLDQLYRHQELAVEAVLEGQTTIVSTGTGSGKTEAFLIPILDWCLKHPGPGVKALLVYPMNALANDQVRRLEKAVRDTTVRCGVFVGSTSETERDKLRADPPDILITNYVMLDWMLTRVDDQRFLPVPGDTLRYLVLDEIHTYRGNKATHLACLLARLKSLLKSSVIQIGTSATLQSHHGYLGGDASQPLDQFIKPLLSVDKYCFVQPEYDAEPPVTLKAWPAASNAGSLGWAMQSDVDAGLQRLSLLTGERYSSFDLSDEDFSKSKPYQDLFRSPYVQLLKQALNEGTLSFLDLVQLLCRNIPPGYDIQSPEALVKSYLSAIAFINFQSKDKPLLDFRVHLFLHDLNGALKLCLHCQHYHSGRQEYCQECGFPLFYAYRHDIHQCLGKVSDGRLKWELRRESDDKKNAFYVLISTDVISPEQGSALTFSDEIGPLGNDRCLDFMAGGPLKLAVLPEITAADALNLTVSLAERSQDYQYLYHLVKALLTGATGAQRKLLGFIDNREQASRYAIVLQDEFASEFFDAYYRFVYPEGRALDLPMALDILHKQVPPTDKLSQDEQALFAELDLWFYRWIGQPPRQRGRQRRDFLQIKDPETYSELEQHILTIFLQERSIAKKDFDDAQLQSHFIRFALYRATAHKGMHLDPADSSNDPDYPSISLGEQAEEYGEVVRQWGADKIRRAVLALVDRGVITAYPTPDGKTHYALRPEQIILEAPGSSPYETYEDLRQTYWLTTACHSAELKADDRVKVEQAFQSGQLHFLMATPTLEMGVDIGQLQNVLMVGVPPLPSNYAQRAGRAGRGRQQNYALIVTFCLEGREHDSYYFNQPRQMINGVISPPTFNPHNLEVVKKHVNAWALAGHLESRASLERFASEIDRHLPSLIASAPAVFGPDSPARCYLEAEFRAGLLNLVANLSSMGRQSPRQWLYQVGFFPDYSFRHDQVYVLDADQAYADVHLNALLLSDQALSEREPELAYYKFSPGETVFMAGEVYTILPEGYYKELQIDAQTTARSYRYLTARRQTKYAAPAPELRRFARQDYFDSQQTLQDKKKVLGMAYDPDCSLMFVNEGSLRHDKVEAFGAQRPFRLGYEIRRQVLIFKFDRLICAEDRLYLSLISALERTIKDEFGLDEGEIRLLVDIKAASSTGVASQNDLYIVLYDYAGNGNVPLRRIFERFDQLLERAYAKLRDCQGSVRQPCETGCYQCLKSFSTQQFAGQVDKKTALMFLGYLLGINPFQPSLPPLALPATTYDLVLRLERSGPVYVVQSPARSYSDRVEAEQNQTIFNLLTKAIQAEFSPAMHSLKIVAREDYIVAAINSGTINKNKTEFAQLQFELLRFRHVIAEKG